MLKIYGIKNCDSVRKALKFLKSHAIPYEFIDFRETPVSIDTVRSWLTHIDIKTWIPTVLPNLHQGIQIFASNSLVLKLFNQITLPTTG